MGRAAHAAILALALAGCGGPPPVEREFLVFGTTAELTLRGVAHEARELLVKGLIEPEVAAKRVALFGRGILADHGQHRIAHVLEERERHEGHHQHHDRRLQQTADDEGEHGS